MWLNSVRAASGGVESLWSPTQDQGVDREVDALAEIEVVRSGAGDVVRHVVAGLVKGVLVPHFACSSRWVTALVSPGGLRGGQAARRRCVSARRWRGGASGGSRGRCRP